MTERFLVLECAALNCDVEVHLNDVPVIRRGQEIGRFFGGPVNELAVDGMNELALVVNPGPTPSTALTGRPGRERRHARGAEVVARLSWYPLGAQVGGSQADELLRVTWEAPEDPRERRCYPQVVTGRVDLGAVFGRWSWQDAPRVTLDDEAREGVLDLVDGLHFDLEQGDPESLLDAVAVRCEEIERAYQLEPGDKEEQLREIILMDAGQPGYGLDALEDVDLDLRLCARDRLVEVIAEDWEPALRDAPSPEGEVGSYELRVALVDGEWIALR